ncbi:hypothetical protein TKK_0010374 [Trichogramma kaykai]|uniref:Cytochrome P450 n=1 Tax=Trichogramma kaykai TaxID=54128 RepID=A0ABD2WWS2_9HYME
MWLFLATIIVLACTAYLVIFHFWKLGKIRKLVKCPGPPSIPFIGSAHYFMGSTEDILNEFRKWMNMYPSPFHAWLGTRLFYVVYEPQQLKTILASSKAIEKEDLYKFARPWMGTGLFTAPASKWRVHRKLIMPTFNPRILEGFVEIFAKQANVLVKELRVELDAGEFDIFQYVSLCTLDIICETAMGVPSSVQVQRKSLYVDAAKRLFEIMFSRMLKIWMHPDIVFNLTRDGRNWRQGIRFVHDLTDQVIKKKKLALMSSNKTLQDGEFKKAFLDQLMELTNEGKKFTDEELREEVDTMMIAGNDTTALVNTYVLFVLALFPDVQEKVYQEQFEIYGDSDPGDVPVRHEDLNRMDYLERVIKETLRIFPIAPIVVRKITDDLNIGEHTLVKGSSVVLAFLKTHWSEEYWPDPMRFDPDRFLPEECLKRHPYTFLPFSGGQRNCIGRKYAMMAMKVLLATIVRKYILIKDQVILLEDIRLKIDLMLKPVEPITLRIEKRHAY